MAESMTYDPKNTNLYKKLYEIMSETTAVAKDLTVAYKNVKYNAVSESQILDQVKPLLKKHRVLILPVETHFRQEQTMTMLEAVWKVVDVDTGEFELLMSPGNGADMQDKGTGKAFTYAYKALFSKMFMLYSGEDTDNTHSDQLTADEESKKKKLVELYDLMTDDVKQKILSGYKIKDIEDLPRNNWGPATAGMMKRLEKK